MARFLIAMVVFLAVVVAGIGLSFTAVSQAFLAGPILNGGIVAVLAIAVIHAFRGVRALSAELAWIEAARRMPERSLSNRADWGLSSLTGPAAAALKERSGRRPLSTSAVQMLLDGVGGRLEEPRETARYLVGLLVFLGLLGTFWGLMTTIHGVSAVIDAVDVAPGGDVAAAVTMLKDGLRTPLSGMGVAFSSSLFGLSGSLIAGFLALQLGKAQNAFYRGFEAWLNSAVQNDETAASAPPAAPAYIGALLEQTAEALDAMQRTLAHAEDRRHSEWEVVKALAERLEALTETLTALTPVLEGARRDAREALASGRDGTDRVWAGLRAIDQRLHTLTETAPAVAEALAAVVREELRVLARTVAALPEGYERSSSSRER